APDLAARLRDLAKASGATTFVVLLAAFDAMLFRLTGAADLIVGTPMSGRTQPQFNRVVGYLVNPVPLRTAVGAGMTFRPLIARVRDTVRGAFYQQVYPLALMVQQAQIARDPSRSPLFETFFSAVRGERSRKAVEGSNGEEPAPLRLERFDLPQL